MGGTGSEWGRAEWWRLGAALRAPCGRPFFSNLAQWWGLEFEVPDNAYEMHACFTDSEKVGGSWGDAGVKLQGKAGSYGEAAAWGVSARGGWQLVLPPPAVGLGQQRRPRPPP